RGRNLVPRPPRELLRALRGRSAAADRQPPQIEVPTVSGRREDDRAAVGRPRRVAIDVITTGQEARLFLAAEWRDPQARPRTLSSLALGREHDPAAVRRDRRVTV